MGKHRRQRKKNSGIKKPLAILADDKGVLSANTEILTTPSIIQNTTQNQVLLGEQQLRRLLEFVRDTNNCFDEISVLTTVIAEKSKKRSTVKTLARLACTLANNFQDFCLEESNYFRKCSPELAKAFADELRNTDSTS